MAECVHVIRVEVQSQSNLASLSLVLTLGLSAVLMEVAPVSPVLLALTPRLSEPQMPHLSTLQSLCGTSGVYCPPPATSQGP